MSYKDNSTLNGCYYLTFNVVEWVDIFTRPVFKQIIVESLNYFIEKKGLIVYGWCLMTNHLHLIARSKEGFSLTILANEFKKFTTKIILQDIDAESEVRRIWIMKKFKEAGGAFRFTDKFQVWQPQIHSMYLDPEDPETTTEKLEFIHAKPVRDRIVTTAEDYLHSSARDYSGIKGLVNIDIPGDKDGSQFILRHMSFYTQLSKIQH